MLAEEVLLLLLSLTSSRRRAVQRALILIACVGIAVALWDLAGDGFALRVLGIRVSSREAYKPLRIAMLAVMVALWLHDNSEVSGVATWHRLHRIAPAAMLTTAILFFVAAVHFGIFAAGGADAYGYVSQAYLWASAHLYVPNPLADVTASVGPAVAPLGYRLAEDPRWLIPIYPPGLPIMMAIAAFIGGPSGVYYVVPALGAAAIVLTFVLAERVANRRVAMLASALVASSPIFLFQSLEPMSDVPVTACWLAVWVFALSRSRGGPFAAGLAASIAILTRPNLVPLAVVPAFLVTRRARPWRSVAEFAAGIIPGCVAVAAFNAALYGSPLETGYGDVSSLYAWNRLGANLRRYAMWLIDLHTPGLVLALAAPFATRVKHARAMLAFTGIVLSSYLFYFVFESWTFVRFALPAVPLLLILASAVVMRGIGRLPIAFRGAAVFLVCSLVPGCYLLKSRELTVFSIHDAEQRYVDVGRAVHDTLERDAVVLTILQSGSLRLYGDRPTVRWDLIEPDNLDFTIKALREGGYRPYIMVEDFEEGPFRQRFGQSSAFGRLDWPAAITYSGLSTTKIYSLTDRDRHCSGIPIVTRAIISGPPRE